jgi:hypothetical protein
VWRGVEGGGGGAGGGARVGVSGGVVGAAEGVGGGVCTEAGVPSCAMPVCVWENGGA